MVEPAPVEFPATPRRARIASTGPPGWTPGKIVRTGVETVDAGAAPVTRLAQESVAIAAGDDMRLVDRDLEAGVGEQRRRGQAANPGANHGDVDSNSSLAPPKRGAGQR